MHYIRYEPVFSLLFHRYCFNFRPNTSPLSRKGHALKDTQRASSRSRHRSVSWRTASKTTATRERAAGRLRFCPTAMGTTAVPRKFARNGSRKHPKKICRDVSSDSHLRLPGLMPRLFPLHRTSRLRRAGATAELG